MGEFVLPTWIVPADDGETHEWVDDTSVAFRPQFGPGPEQRQSYGGPRLKLTRRHVAVRGEERAVLQTILLALRGRTNTLRTKLHQAFRGSFLSTYAPEMYINQTFGQGTLGWSHYTDYAVSVTDRIYRGVSKGTSGNSTAIAGGGSFAAFQVMNNVLTQYAPYATRGLIRLFGPGAQLHRVYANFDESAHAFEVGFPDAGGYAVNGRCAHGVNTSASTGVYTAITAPAGSGIDILYLSSARCAMADAPDNILLHSDDLDHATWGKGGSSISANSMIAPDGTVTAENLVENGANTSHFISQSVATSTIAEDYTLGVALCANARTWALLEIVEAGNSYAYAYVNTVTGAIGASGLSGGTNMAHLRVSTTPLGGGWRYFSITALKKSAAASVTALIAIAISDGVAAYQGNGTASLRVWRPTMKPSSYASRLVLTTTAQQLATQQIGNQLVIKGLPKGVGGLAMPGDWFEVNNELKMATASLNADLAGIGVLQFEPPLLRGVSDNVPVIFRDPMGKFVLSGPQTITNRFQTQSDIDYQLEHINE